MVKFAMVVFHKQFYKAVNGAQGFLQVMGGNVSELFQFLVFPGKGLMGFLPLGQTPFFLLVGGNVINGHAGETAPGKRWL